jgi:hypothetical protein
VGRGTIEACALPRHQIGGFPGLLKSFDIDTPAWFSSISRILQLGIGKKVSALPYDVVVTREEKKYPHSDIFWIFVHEFFFLDFRR